MSCLYLLSIPHEPLERRKIKLASAIRRNLLIDCFQIRTMFKNLYEALELGEVQVSAIRGVRFLLT